VAPVRRDSVICVDVQMVTESGDVAVPPGARWAAIVTSGHAEDQRGAAGRTVVHVDGSPVIPVEVDAGGVVIIEWLFDSDEADAH
jgi:hypothetical protein